VGSDIGFKEGTVCSDIGFQEETVCSDIGFQEETVCSDIGFKEETVCSDIGFKEETVCSDIGFKEEIACSDIGFKEEVACSDIGLGQARRKPRPTLCRRGSRTSAAALAFFSARRTSDSCFRLACKHTAHRNSRRARDEPRQPGSRGADS